MTDEVDKNEENKLQNFVKNPNVVDLPTHGLVKEQLEWVEVSYGPMGSEYVWSFSSFHPRRLFPKDPKKVVQIIVTYLNKVIPESIEVDCIIGSPEWEIRPITVIAHNFTNKWNFDEDEMKKYVPEICSLISKEIERANPPKRL